MLQDSTIRGRPNWEERRQMQGTNHGLFKEKKRQGSGENTVLKRKVKMIFERSNESERWVRSLRRRRRGQGRGGREKRAMELERWLRAARWACSQKAAGGQAAHSIVAVNGDLTIRQIHYYCHNLGFSHANHVSTFTSFYYYQSECLDLRKSVSVVPLSVGGVRVFGFLISE